MTIFDYKTGVHKRLLERNTLFYPNLQKFSLNHCPQSLFNSLTSFQYAATLTMNPLVRISILAERNCDVKPVMKSLN